jgi:integrase
MPLTDRKVQNAKPGVSTKDGSPVARKYLDGGGLYIQVTPGERDEKGQISKSLSWLFRYATTEAERAANPKLPRERWMGLGSYPDVSLADARDKAADARRLRKQGMDPITTRDAQRAAQTAASAKAKTFDQCCDGYVLDHEKGWGADHKRVWTNSIRDYATPVFGKLPVATVDTPLVLKVLKPIWLTKHETARRLRARVESVLDWATAHHYREGSNPARWKGHLSEALDKTDNVHIVENHPALPYPEIGKLMDELQPCNDRDALCLQLLILTAVRVGAATGARAEEFDLTKRIWKIPPSRMKRRGKRKALPFRVPLSDAAIKIVERAAVKNGPLFPGCYDKSLARAHGRADITTHGFRSSFRDWAGEQTNFPREVIEMAMGHAVADETEEAYFRSDLFVKRARLMAAWGAYCASPVLERRNNVAPIRQAG